MTSLPFSGRVEDHRLLVGEGRYSADANVPDQLWAVFLRSPAAHAEIKRIDVSGAAAMPGVVAVLQGKDFANLGYGRAAVVPGQMHANGSAMEVPNWPPLAIERVRFLGEPVCVVIAETEAQALDAVEVIEFDYEELPNIVSTEYDPQPPIAIWPHASQNVALDFAFGEPAAVENAFRSAAHRVKARTVNQRMVVNAMEPRAAIAHYVASEARFDLYAGSQGTSALRDQIALAMGLKRDEVRVVTRDVGGSFGAKTHLYPEYVVLLEASRQTGRPIKWIASRSESFLSDTQGRDSVVDGELALDAEGRFLAVRVQSVVNIGAYQSSHATYTATQNFLRCIAGIYRTPQFHVAIKCVYTNTVPVAPYRGAGRPEANLILERLINVAAREMSIDPSELRRRNIIASKSMPYRVPSGMTYDSGDFEAALLRALQRADYSNFPARRAIAKSRGRLRGIGIGCYLEISGGSPVEDMRLEVTEDGVVTIRSGLQSNGQGHATVFPPLVAKGLGLSVDRVQLGEGDSSLVPEGTGSFGSRSTTVGGAAAAAGAQALIARAKTLAAALLESSVDDVAYAEGILTVKGTDRSLTLGEIAKRAGPFFSLSRARAEMTFPNGCHVAEVEIDPETGVTRFVNFVAEDDVGRTLNPMLVEGQIHGGIAQGLGQVLLENAVFDRDSGQLITGSFMDYVLPRADDLPSYFSESLEVPCTTNALGTKGAGESGTTGALVAGYNAVMDALGQAEVESFDMPATPARVWHAITALANRDANAKSVVAPLPVGANE